MKSIKNNTYRCKYADLDNKYHKFELDEKHHHQFELDKKHHYHVVELNTSTRKWEALSLTIGI